MTIQFFVSHDDLISELKSKYVSNPPEVPAALKEILDRINLNPLIVPVGCSSLSADDEPCKFNIEMAIKPHGVNLLSRLFDAVLGHLAGIEIQADTLTGLSLATKLNLSVGVRQFTVTAMWPVSHVWSINAVVGTAVEKRLLLSAFGKAVNDVLSGNRG